MKALIASSVMALATAAAAADRPVKDPSSRTAAPAQAKFEALDRDRDGALNKREAKLDASIAAQFDSLDINLDGYISRPEYVASVQRATRPQPPRDEQ